MLLSTAFFLITFSVGGFGLPTERGGDGDCPFIINQQGSPSMDDIKAFPPSGAKPMDLPSLAVAASLILNYPQTIVPMFINPEKPDVVIPKDAKLLPAEGGESCLNSNSAPPEILRRDSKGNTNRVEVLVNLPGGPVISRVKMSGDKLSKFDNSHNSAWIALLQATMLKFAKRDNETQPVDPADSDGTSTSIGTWNNVKYESSTTFDRDATLQECNSLGRMLHIATGKETLQIPVESISEEKLEETLKAMSRSPVLVIPQATQQAHLPSDRIWIGKKRTKDGKAWTFYNPVERNEKDVTIEQLRESAKDIVYITDHSAL